MFESDEESSSFFWEGNKSKTKENVSLEAWANYFCKNKKDVQLQKILEKQFNSMKIMYCFLEETQIMGITFSRLGIPNICGQVDKKYLRQFSTCKKKVRSYEKIHKSPKKVVSTTQQRIKQQTGSKQQILRGLRYQPVAKRWSDIAFSKGMDKTTNIPLDKTFEYDYNPEESAKSTNKSYVDDNKQKALPLLENRKLAQNIKFSNLLQKQNNPKKTELHEKSTQLLGSHNDPKSQNTINVTSVPQNQSKKPLVDKQSNIKKSVRFDENLCSFAPTPEEFQSSIEQTDVDGNSTKTTKNDSEIQFDKLIEDSMTDSSDNFLVPGNSIRNQSVHQTSSEQTLTISQSNVNTKNLPLNHLKNKTNSNISTEKHKDQDSSKSYVIEPYSELNFTIEDSSSSPSNLEVQDKAQSNISDSIDQLGTLIINLDNTLKGFSGVDINSEGVKKSEYFKAKLQEKPNKLVTCHLSQDVQVSNGTLMSGKACTVIKCPTDEPVVIEATPSTEEDSAANKMNYGIFENNSNMESLNHTEVKNNNIFDSDKNLQEQSIENNRIPLYTIENNILIQGNGNYKDETILTYIDPVCLQKDTKDTLQHETCSFQPLSPNSASPNSISDRDYISDDSQILTNTNVEMVLNSQDIAKDCGNVHLLDIKKHINSSMGRCESPIKTSQEPGSIECIKKMPENAAKCQYVECKTKLKIKNMSSIISVNRGTSETKCNEHCTGYETTPISQSSSYVLNQPVTKKNQLNKVGFILAPSKKDDYKPLLSPNEPSIKSVCKSLFPIENTDDETNLSQRKQTTDVIEQEKLETTALSVMPKSGVPRNKLPRIEKEHYALDLAAFKANDTSSQLEKERKILRNTEIVLDNHINICSKNNKNLNEDHMSVSSKNLLNLSDEITKSNEQIKQYEGENYEDREYFAVSDDEVSNHELSGVALPKLPIHNHLNIFSKNIKSPNEDHMSVPSKNRLNLSDESNEQIKQYKVENLEDGENYVVSDNEVSNHELSSVALPKSHKEIICSSVEINSSKVESFEEADYFAVSNEELNDEFSGFTPPKSLKEIVDGSKVTNRNQVESFEEDGEYFPVSNDEVLSNAFSLTVSSKSLDETAQPLNKSSTLQNNNISNLTSKEVFNPTLSDVKKDNLKYNVKSPEDPLNNVAHKKHTIILENSRAFADNISQHLNDSTKQVVKDISSSAHFNFTNKLVDSEEINNKYGTETFEEPDHLVMSDCTNDTMGEKNCNLNGENKTTTLSLQNKTLQFQSSFCEREIINIMKESDINDDKVITKYNEEIRDNDNINKKYEKEKLDLTCKLDRTDSKVYPSPLPLSENLCKDNFSEDKSEEDTINKENTTEENLCDIGVENAVGNIPQAAKFNAIRTSKICDTFKANVSKQHDSKKNNTTDHSTHVVYSSSESIQYNFTNIKSSREDKITDENRLFENSCMTFKDDESKLNNTTLSVKSTHISQIIDSNKASQPCSEIKPKYFETSINQSIPLTSNNISNLPKNLIFSRSGLSDSSFSPPVNTSEKKSSFKLTNAINIVYPDKNNSKLSQTIPCSSSGKAKIESQLKYTETSRLSLKNKVNETIQSRYTAQVMELNQKENHKNVKIYETKCLQNDQQLTKTLFQNASRNIPVKINEPKEQYSQKYSNPSVEDFNMKKWNEDGQILLPFSACKPLETIHSLNEIHHNRKRGPVTTFSTVVKSIRLGDQTDKNEQRTIKLGNVDNNITKPTDFKNSTNIQILKDETTENIPSYRSGLKQKNLSPIILNHHNKKPEIFLTNPNFEYNKENANSTNFMSRSNSPFSEENSPLSYSEDNGSLPRSLSGNYLCNNNPPDKNTSSNQSKLKQIKRKLDLQIGLDMSNNLFTKNMFKKRLGILETHNQKSLDNELISEKNSIDDENSGFEEEDETNYSQTIGSSHSSEFLRDQRSVENSNCNVESYSCSLKSDPTFSPLSDDLNGPKMDEFMKEGEDSTYFFDKFLEDLDSNSQSVYSASLHDEEPMDFD